MGALLEMAATRHGSRCQQPLYHVVFNAAKGEQLSTEQWERAMEMWEQAMGLSGHQRAVVQHLKDGRWHTHAVWNRIDPETGKAVSIGRDHFTAKRVSREIEREFGLQQVRDKAAGRRRGQQPPLKWETEQARRTNTDPKKIREQLAESWALSDSGQSFQHALEERDLRLAKGERRPFIVLDRDGNMFALSGRVLPHARMKDIRAKLADIDREALPDVAETRARPMELARERRRAKKNSEAATEDATDNRTESLPRGKSDLQEQHKRAHLELNQRAIDIDRKHEGAMQELARSHAREQKQLAEKQRDRWWHKIIGKGEKLRTREMKERERQELQQTRDIAQLEKRKQKDLATIETKRKELRRQEKAQQALSREFNERGRKPRPSAAPTRATDQFRERGERQRSASEELARKNRREELRRQEREQELARQRQRDRGRQL
jgi:hypothetical protein